MGTDSMNLVSFDINSGAPLWTWTAPSSNYVSLVAATDGGGVVVNQQSGTGNDSPQSVIRFDPSGNPTPDIWTSTAAASAGASSLTNVNYIASDAFSATPTGSTATSMFSSGTSVDFAMSPWALVQPDSSSDPKINVTLSVANIFLTTPQDIQSDSSITTKVNNATDFWWNDPLRFPHGCGGFPQLDIADIGNGISNGEFLRRFCGFSSSGAKCTSIHGSQLTFLRSVTAPGPADGYTIP
jgi:hypothetical protein